MLHPNLIELIYFNQWIVYIQVRIPIHKVRINHQFKISNRYYLEILVQAFVFNILYY